MCSVFKTLEIIFLFCTCLYIDNGEQTSSQRKSCCLSGKLLCLHVNFVFRSRKRNPSVSSVCLGYEASSLCVSLSMPKIPNKELKTNRDNTATVYSFAFRFKIHSSQTGHWKGQSGSLPPGYFIFGLYFFVTCPLGLVDLFHLLAHCLVSKKVSVKYWVTF